MRYVIFRLVITVVTVIVKVTVFDVTILHTNAEFETKTRNCSPLLPEDGFVINNVLVEVPE